MGTMGIPYGIIANSTGVLLGGAIGYALKNRLPERIRTAFPPMCGVVSMSMGVVSLYKVHCLPAVVLAIIIGTVIGECLSLEAQVTKAVGIGVNKLAKGRDQTLNMQLLIGIIVLFCASGTGIYGAMESRFTGDHSILLTKAFLDFFAATMFSMILGGIICCIAVPQFLIFFCLYLSAGFILPLTTPEMLRDFTACGGAIMLATGLRIGEIKSISVVNMLPAFVLVMPISYLYTMLLL